jgi:hypothetical protein
MRIDLELEIHHRDPGSREALVETKSRWLGNSSEL